MLVSNVINNVDLMAKEASVEGNCGITI